MAETPEEHTPVYKKAELIGIVVIALITGALLLFDKALDVQYYGFMGSLAAFLCGGKLLAKKLMNGGKPGG